MMMMIMIIIIIIIIIITIITIVVVIVTIIIPLSSSWYVQDKSWLSRAACTNICMSAQ